MKSGKEFIDKVVLVTGSGQGIGKNIAQVFARAGAQVIVSGQDADLGKQTAAEFKKMGYKAHQEVTNLSKVGAAQKLVDKVVQKFKRIDVLVNNAKFNPRRPFLQETEKTWDEGLSVSLKAAFFCAQSAISYMKKTGGGSIVNISSVAGRVVGEDSVTYHLAKAAMNQLTRYLAVHSAAFGIRVNGVAPGFIIKDHHLKRFNDRDNKKYRDTANFVHPIGRTGLADEIADVVLFLASHKSSFITGQTLTVDGGLTLLNQNDVIFRYAKIYD